jgi:hypothetical protein
MTTPIGHRNGYPAVATDMRLLGEIITWSCSGVSIAHTNLIDALRDASLDEGVAREQLGGGPSPPGPGGGRCTRSLPFAVGFWRRNGGPGQLVGDDVDCGV